MALTMVATSPPATTASVSRPSSASRSVAVASSLPAIGRLVAVRSPVHRLVDGQVEDVRGQEILLDRGQDHSVGFFQGCPQVVHADARAAESVRAAGVETLAVGFISRLMTTMTAPQTPQVRSPVRRYCDSSPFAGRLKSWPLFVRR